MKKVKLLRTIEHPKGNIEKDSIYLFNEETGFYEFKSNGIVISTVNEVSVNGFKDLFKRI